MTRGLGKYLLMSLAVLYTPAPTAPGQQAEKRPFLAAAEAALKEIDAGTDPRKLLDLANQVEPREARRILQRVSKLLALENQLPAGDRLTLVRLFAKTLRGAAHTAEEIDAVLGSKTTPKSIARQVFFRRYREQWIYDQPVPLCVVFDCIKGADPSVQTVLALPSVNF